jgi:hypothetical protein
MAELCNEFELHRTQIARPFTMSLKKMGKYWYGTTQADLHLEIVRYSKANGYPASKATDSICTCANRTFKLETDEVEGAAKRTCTTCGSQHLMGDSAEYIEGAELEPHECVCGSQEFELRSGVALYEQSNDVCWYYIGCRCVRCNLVGVFADWKCEAGDADNFLTQA